MTIARYPTRYRRLPHGAEAFAVFHSESWVLLNRATQLDAAQRVLARELADVRTGLAELRVVMWPRIDPKDIVHGFRRTRLGGSPPIPPAANNSLPLQGKHLRSTALAILLRNERPMTLVEIHRELHLNGYVIASREPVKRLGNALAYEVVKGRARRVDRGTYEIDRLNPGERRRMSKIGVAPRSPQPGGSPGEYCILKSE
jgi:hypothetical protein